jgi:hypothetical protein
MKEALIDLLLDNMTLKINRNFNYCVVTVSDENNSIEQYLPMDGHLDYALPDCIKYCIKQLNKQSS